MKSASNLILLLVVIAAVAGVYFQQRYETETTLVVKVPHQQIPLVDKNSNPVTLGDLAGKWVIAFFGYRSCPDVCPMTLSYLNREWAELSRYHDQLAVVYVSVDPKRDIPPRLKEYVDHFNPDFHAWTGDEQDLQALTKALGAYYSYDQESGSELGYLVEHSASLFLLNPKGELQLKLRPPHSKGLVVRTVLQQLGGQI
mgnify:CR=1 FL=1